MAGDHRRRGGNPGAVSDLLYRPGAVYLAAVGGIVWHLRAYQEAGAGIGSGLGRGGGFGGLPVAIAYIVWIEQAGHGTFTSEGTPHMLLLISAGLITALPLLCFAQGARTLRLSTIGMLQYLTPIMQMLWALFVTQEHFSTHRWIGFGIIGVAVSIYIADLIRVRQSAPRKSARRGRMRNGCARRKTARNGRRRGAGLGPKAAG